MRRALTGGLIFGAGVAASLWLGAKVWRQRTVARLQAESNCVQTTQGVIECSILYPQGERTPVLLVHGSPGGYDQGLLVGEQIFKADRMLIAPSRPGYLRTPLSVGKTPEEQADAFAALLDALKVDRVLVFAISGGGPSALEFARRYPERTVGLILVASVLAALPNPLDLNTYRRQDITAWLTLNLSKLFPAMLGQAVVTRSSATRDAVRRLAETAFPVDLRIDGWYNDVEQSTNLPPIPFEQIGCPTLVVHGSADELVPYAQAEAAAAGVPNAKLVTIEGGEHNFSIFDPQAGRQIHNFLRDHAL